MGSPLDRLMAEYAQQRDQQSPQQQSPLDALAAKYGAISPEARTLAMAGLSRVATPEEAHATGTSEIQPNTPAGMPSMQADVTAVEPRPGGKTGGLHELLRVPAELAAGMAAPFVDVLVRPTTEDVARRENPSMAEIGTMAKAGYNILAPLTPEQRAALYGDLAPQSRGHLLLSGAQAAALVAAGPGEAAAKDVLEAGAARVVGSDAVQGVVKQAALHAGAGTAVNAALGALFDPEHPVRGAVIGGGAGLILGGAGGAVAGRAAAAEAERVAAQTADRAVLRETARGFEQGPMIAEGASGEAVLDAAEPQAPTPVVAQAESGGTAASAEASVTPEQSAAFASMPDVALEREIASSARALSDAERRGYTPADVQRIGTEQRAMRAELERRRHLGQPGEVRTIATAETGQPFEQALFRGQGRADSPYNPLGAQVPILGEGRYGTPSREHAAFFGPRITEHTTRLDNPLVIDSDGQWRALTREAGWKFPNPFGQEPAAVEADIARLRTLIEQNGHDGVVVRVPASELTGKTLQKVFGESQVVEFHSAPATDEAQGAFEVPEDEVVPTGEPLTPHAGTETAVPTPDAASRLAPADRVVRNRGEPPASPLDALAATYGAESAPASDAALAPGSPDQAARTVNRYTDAIRRTFNPTARSEGAATTGFIIRARAGERAAMDERAHAALRVFAKTFDRQSDAERLDFIDRIETGRAQPTPELDKAATTMRELFDGARDAIRALGTGKLERFVENYFPHLWSSPEEAQKVIARIMSKRSLTGPGSFLKQRTIPTIKEGMEAGLTPLTTNPIDLVMLRLKEMHKYLAGQRIIEEMKSEGLARFVSAFQKAPDGYVQIDDKIGTVYGPPTVTMTEAYDKIVKERLDQIVDGLGVRHVRKPKIGHGGALGFAEGGSKITTRAGTPLDVVYHELGHAIDFKYSLWHALTETGTPGERSAIQKELRSLADLRYEGQEVSQHFKRYVRNRFEKMAVSLQALLYAPDRMAEVAPILKAKLTAFIEARPELRDLLDLKPSLVHGATTHEIKVGGLVITGRYYAPEPVARVLNNYLAPGLRGNPFYDLYRSIGNGLNQAQLGFSAFHLGFTSLDATVSKTALGLEQLAAGRITQGLGSIARTPIEPFANYLRGSKVLREYFHPGSQGGDMAQVVDALIQGGGRVRMDDFYRAGSSAEFFKTLRNSRTALSHGRLLRATGQGALAGWKGLGTVLDAVAWPTMQHVVPRQKLGVFADMARFELSRLPANASQELIRATMAKAWDSVDSRLGQIVYDNLFWPRAAKDLSLASVRSVGWNIGTIREIGGGMFDLSNALRRLKSGEPVLTHRAAYVAALPFVVGLLGAITQYLYTGERPRDLKDYFYPRTGRSNPDGTEERVQLPSYMRDVGAFARHPYETAKHKIHPLVAVMADMLENENWYGDMIRNPDDPIVRQLQQEAEYVADQFVPFGVQNALAEHRRGQEPVTIAGSFVGVTPAPREVTRSAAVNRMEELLRRRTPHGATPEEARASEARSRVREAIRAGGPAGAAAIREAIRSGAISASEASRIAREAERPATESNFSRLTLLEALDVYRLGTPSERAAWGPILAGKLGRTKLEDMTPDEIARVQAGLDALATDRR